MSADVVEKILARTANERDRLLLRTLLATEAPLSAVLALRPRDVRRSGLLLSNTKESRLIRLAEPHLDLLAELRRWARAHALADDEPLFFSRERGTDGRRKAIDRVRAWQVVDLAVRRARGPDRPQTIAVRDVAAGPVRPTNIGLPPVRADLVARPRLAEALDGVLQHPVTLVAAPAGFGKTTTLATWAAQLRNLAVAWVSLGIRDNDPVRFWRAVLAALQAQQPSLGLDASARLQARAPIGLVVDSLLGDLAALVDPIALVLDDYHLIQTPEVHSSVATLLAARLPAWRLIISTRTDPPLPLARLRSLGQLLELRAAQLAFSEQEAADLLQDALGIQFGPEQMAALGARTEGWVAGLHLAAISLRAHPDLSTALAAFAGSDRAMVDYFAEEVLAELPEQARVFLQRTSILERLTPPLCDAVVGEPGSAAMLEVLERGNVFLTPVDQGRQWFRYHQLFADALRHRLERIEPTLVPALHTRASAWYASNEMLEDAVEHALASGCWDRAADLIARALIPVVLRGEELTARRWFLGVPETVRMHHPGFARGSAVALLLSGDLTRLETFLAIAEPALESAGDRMALGGVLGIHAIQLGIQAQLSGSRDDLTRAVAYAERVLIQSDQPAQHRQEAFTALLHCHLLRGDTAAAARCLDAIALALPGHSMLTRWSQGVFAAQHHHQRGDLTPAAAGYRRLLEQIGERALYMRHEAWLGLATIALERNRLDHATEFLDRIEHADRVSGRTYRTVEVAAPLVRGRLLRARQELGAAGAALRVAEAAAQLHGSAAWAGLARAEAAWVALLDGRWADAGRWADELDKTDLDAFAREPEALTLARVRRAQGAADEVLPLLERMMASSEQVARTDSTIAILVQLALVRAQAGHASGALSALERAVRLAEPGGYVRVFLDEGEALHDLLRQLLRGSGSGAAVSRLLYAVGADAHGSARSRLLTAREHEVLRLLALGLSNRGIAERLVTTESTVKSHVHHVIDKLGVASRAEVLVRARELGELGAAADF